MSVKVVITSARAKKGPSRRSQSFSTVTLTRGFITASSLSLRSTLILVAGARAFSATLWSPRVLLGKLAGEDACGPSTRLPHKVLGTKVTELSQVLISRWMKQVVNLWRAHVFWCDQINTGIDTCFNVTASKMIDESLHTKIAHLEGVLHDKRIQLTSTHCVNECLIGIEPNERDFSRLRNILQRQQHSGS